MSCKSSLTTNIHTAKIHFEKGLILRGLYCLPWETFDLDLGNCCINPIKYTNDKKGNLCKHYPGIKNTTLKYNILIRKISNPGSQNTGLQNYCQLSRLMCTCM